MAGLAEELTLEAERFGVRSGPRFLLGVSMGGGEHVAGTATGALHSAEQAAASVAGDGSLTDAADGAAGGAAGGAAAAAAGGADTEPALRVILPKGRRKGYIDPSRTLKSLKAQTLLRVARQRCKERRSALEKVRSQTEPGPSLLDRSDCVPCSMRGHPARKTDGAVPVSAHREERSQEDDQAAAEFVPTAHPVSSLSHDGGSRRTQCPPSHTPSVALAH
jgi:hypothetical protein